MGIVRLPAGHRAMLVRDSFTSPLDPIAHGAERIQRRRMGHTNRIAVAGAQCDHAFFDSPTSWIVNSGGSSTLRVAMMLGPSAQSAIRGLRGEALGP
jgi:hypothetical protein